MLDLSLGTLDLSVDHVHAHLDGFLDGGPRHDSHPVVETGGHNLVPFPINFDTTDALARLTGYADREFFPFSGDGQVPDWALIRHIRIVAPELRLSRTRRYFFTRSLLEEGVDLFAEHREPPRELV